MLTLLLLAASFDSPTTQPVKVEELQGRIAFISNRSGSNDVYTMNPDGSDIRRITKTVINEGWPRWSPDGKQIAFTRSKDGVSDIWLVNADGSGEKQLTRTGDATHPTWAPDGKRLAIRREPVGFGDLYILEVESGKMTKLTSEDSDEWAPYWSPDGKTIVYAHAGDREDIDVVEVATGATRILVAQRYEDSLPAYSPDGKWLVCSTHPNRVATEIVLCKANGKDPQRLTFTTDDQKHAFNFGATFSPCGRAITFTSGRDQNFEIYRMDLGTREVTRLTNDLARDTRAHWGPVGSTSPTAAE